MKALFFQLYDHETSTYTYLISDPKTGEAALIDPVLEMVERDARLIEESGLKLKYILETHIHADHITGASEIRRRTGAQTAVNQKAQIQCADIQLQEGKSLLLGSKKIDVIFTPGHTNSCTSYYFEDRVFTGDALLIRGTGRTDFQQGSSETLFKSIREKLFTLPDETLVYPAHDYKGHTSTTIGLEKKYNPRVGLNKTLEEFIQIMNELKLSEPKKIHEAVPANLMCGQRN